MKGITSSPMISRIDCGVTSTWEPSSAAASRGVKITPRTFDTDAELTARATLPRATDVNAIEDCTVEGSRQRKRNHVAMNGLMMAVGRSMMRSLKDGI